MTGDARIFNTINTNDSNGYDSITFGDNGNAKVKGLGKIAISNDLSISNVLLVESLNFNLLSVAQLCDLRFKCIFGVDDVFATFKSFIKGIHNEFDTTIKRVRSDNGSELKNIKIDELCDEFRIRHQFSAKYTPQSNSLVERKNKTLIDMARSMISEYNVSQYFWAKAINTTCYYSNRLYCHPLKEKAPYSS
jgi:hypothetical protein